MPTDHPLSQAEGIEDRNQLTAFMELYTTHFQRLQYYVMALMPTQHDAADVLQETSVVLWSKFSEYERGSNFFAWACAIARLQALKAYERDRRSATRLEPDVFEKLAADAARTDHRSEEALAALELCLAKLAKPDQELIRRRYGPDSSVNRMAEEIGVSANLLSKSLSKIRRTLLACIERTLLSHG